MRELNQEAVLLALCTKTFKQRVIIFRFVLFPLVFRLTDICCYLSVLIFPSLAVAQNKLHIG